VRRQINDSPCIGLNLLPSIHLIIEFGTNTNELGFGIHKRTFQFLLLLFLIYPYKMYLTDKHKSSNEEILKLGNVRIK